MGILQAIIPIEAGMAIILWIGIVIAAQAFQTTPKSHAPAVVVGILPALAGWAILMIQNIFFFLDGKLQVLLQELGVKSQHHFFLSDLGPHLPFIPYALSGIISLSQGFLLTSMVWAAIVVFILEKDFLKSAIWAGIGSLLSAIGLIHAYKLAGNAILSEYSPVSNWQFALAYLLLAVLFGLSNFFISEQTRKN